MFGFVKSLGLPAWPAKLLSQSGGRMRVTFLGTSKTALIHKNEWLPYTRGELEKVDTCRNKRRWGALVAALKELREALNGGKEGTGVKTQTSKEESKGRKIGLRKQQRDNEQKFFKIMKKLVTGRQWQCVRCKFTTGFKYRAKTHAVLCSSMFRARKKRNKVYTCHSCPESSTFASKKLLKKHTKEEHPRVFLCVEHPRPITFTLRHNLLRHIEEFHSSEVKKNKTFECPECDMKSLRRENIIRHVKRRHPLRQEMIELLHNLTAGAVDIVQEKRQNKCYVESLLEEVIKDAIRGKEQSLKENNSNLEDGVLLTKNKPQELSPLEIIVQRILKNVQNKVYVESMLEEILEEVVKGHSNAEHKERKISEEPAFLEAIEQPSFEAIEDNIDREPLAKNNCSTLERIEANKKEFRARFEEIFKDEIETQRKLKEEKVLKNEARKAALKRKREIAESNDEPRRKSARLSEHLLSPSGDNIIEQEAIDDRGQIDKISDTEMIDETFDVTSPDDLKRSEQVNNHNTNSLDLNGEHNKENIPPKSLKKYECDKHVKCSFKTRDNFNLRNHIRIKHEGVPVACPKPWCEMIFETLFEQELHLKVCVFVCNKCGKKLSRPSKMREHQRYEAARAMKLLM